MPIIGEVCAPSLGGSWVSIQHNVAWAEAQINTKWHLDPSIQPVGHNRHRPKKIGSCSTTLRHSAMSSSDSLPRKPTPRIKQCVASYHTTKIIAHRMPVIATCVPKCAAMATSLGTSGPPSNTWSYGPSKPTTQTASRFSRFCTDDRRVSPLQWDAPPPKKLPLPWGICDGHLIRGSLGPPESSTQTASGLVQPFLQGSLVWQLDRPTADHATRSVTIGRIYVRRPSTAMRPNKTYTHFYSPNSPTPACLHRRYWYE